MFCSHCGATVDPQAQFCPNCGQRAAAAAGSAPPAASPPPLAAEPQLSGKAIASLVFGFLFVFLPAAVLAVVLGHLARYDIRRDPARLRGSGMALAGLVLGYVGIAIIPVLIIAAIAIPNLLRARVAANEAAAVSSLRNINIAQVTYASTYRDVGFACELAQLGGSQPYGGNSQAGPYSAMLIDEDLAGGQKSGYRFAIHGCAQDEKGITVAYQVIAEPRAQSQTGIRAFCSDDSGVISFHRSGSGQQCLASGTPLR